MRYFRLYILNARPFWVEISVLAGRLSEFNKSQILTVP